MHLYTHIHIPSSHTHTRKYTLLPCATTATLVLPALYHPLLLLPPLLPPLCVPRWRPRIFSTEELRRGEEDASLVRFALSLSSSFLSFFLVNLVAPASPCNPMPVIPKLSWRLCVRQSPLEKPLSLSGGCLWRYWCGIKLRSWADWMSGYYSFC